MGKLDVLCPREATVRCMTGESTCTEGAPAGSVTAVGNLLSGCASDWTPRPLSVVLSMTLSVSDPQAFVEAAESATDVADGIASAVGVDSDKVDVTLSVARRLEESHRRLQGSVSVDATIEADDASGVADLLLRVGATTDSVMATAISNHV